MRRGHHSPHSWNFPLAEPRHLGRCLSVPREVVDHLLHRHPEMHLRCACCARREDDLNASRPSGETWQAWASPLSPFPTFLGSDLVSWEKP